MYGQMTAGSWIYIGTQGILQGTYETFVAARKAYAKRTGRSARMGAHGGPRGNGRRAAARGHDERDVVPRGRGRPCAHREAARDRATSMRKSTSLDEALDRLEGARKAGKPISLGLLGNAAEIYPELVSRGVTPPIVTDQTSAHDPLNGYVPAGLTLEEAAELAQRRRRGLRRARQGEHGRRGRRRCSR